jgi:maltose phosphorylase
MYNEFNEWKIIENLFDPSKNKISESIFSIGNGRMGQRANFEESYSGQTLQGHYVAGVYYPDKTRVGWWKNGYPEYFAKVLNAPSWIGIKLKIDYEELDLFRCEIVSFYRELDMQKGILTRTCTVKTQSGKLLNIDSVRFCSIVNDECGAIKYAITPLNFNAEIHVELGVDGTISNEDANYDEKFWDEISKEINYAEGYLNCRTKKTGFHVCTGFKYRVFENDTELQMPSVPIEQEKYISNKFIIDSKTNNTYIIYKYAAVVTSLNFAKANLVNECKKSLQVFADKGFAKAIEEQQKAWANKWNNSDVTIEGDIAAQQAIRYNIFQLNQTYTGEDERLNIGPKGFTGEKYGGSTYWDTEAYCIPFYLSTSNINVTKQLLIYRYNHLEKAIENASKLGFKNGAALYPMVTMNGEECHNEWEITFEEIHRNGAIAYAISNYINYTNDINYLANYGLEVLIGIARFWAQRVNWSEDKKRFVMLGVTGPNEYENNVNNNWYTNKIATWCLQFCTESIQIVKTDNAIDFERIRLKTSFKELDELAIWKNIIDNMYFPYDSNANIFLQQDGYMDKEQILVADLPIADRPLNQKWSWDRILRSCFIKQADVLQGIYFFEDEFDYQTIKKNFEFYESRTVHESSLSPCVHAILAAKIGLHAKSYEMYKRSARLDLDNYNNDTDDGLHITSMAGSWLSIIQGFAGFRVKNNTIILNTYLPMEWERYSFKIGFRNAILKITIDKAGVNVNNENRIPVDICINGKTTINFI